jgi:hypothetical protein
MAEYLKESRESPHNIAEFSKICEVDDAIA